MLMGNYVLYFSLLWLLGVVPRALSQPVLTRFSPRSGPTGGGTNISVWGSGFVEITRCSFANLPAASIPSLTAIVHNSTFMTCVLPEITTAFQFPENSTHNIIQFRIVTSPSQQSSEENFLVFNLTTIRVTGLTPSSGFISSSDNRVEFNGTNFVNTSELYCFVGNLREPATFISNQLVSCHLPSYLTPSLQYPQLSLNGDHSGFIPVEKDSNAFVFYSTAPILEKVEFSSSAAQLIMTFDREVELGEENSTRTTQSFECSEIFDNNTNSLLGEAAKCDWQTSQQRVIIIQLHANSTIIPNDAVTLNGASIRARAVQYSMLSASTAVIPTPEGPIPVAVLEAPGAIPSCGMLKLVARNSIYGGGRVLVYEWGAFTGNETLNELIGSHDESFVEIPVQSLADAGPYNFTVTVSNFLGLQDTTTISYLHKSSSEAVLITIYGGHNRGYPVDSDNIVVEATAEIMSCSAIDGVTLEYSWTITDSSDGAAVTLASIDIDNSELWIPPLTLQVGTTYDIQLSVQYTGQPSTAGIATIQVTGLHPELTAALQTGYKSSVRITKQIHLDTSPSRGLLPDHMYEYRWQCDLCGLPDSSISSVSSPTLTLPAEALPLGTYQFTVTITHSSTGMSSTASTMLEVIVAQTGAGVISPSVQLAPPTKWNALSANDKTVVTASVSVPTAATVQWSTVEVKSLGFDHKPVDDLFTSTPTSYSAKSRNSLSAQGDNVELSSLLVASSSESEAINEISLTINPDVLKPGVSYRMKLNATTEDGHSTTAEIDVVTEGQPTSGRLSVAPSSGTALDTTFVITAMDWTDDFGDPPLLYQFGFRLSQQSTKIYWLSPIKFNSQILSYLPIVPVDNNVVLVLRVYDSSAAFATHEMNFSGIANTADGVRHDARSLFINSVREQVTRYGQVSQGLAILTAVIASVNEYSSKFTNVAAFRSDAVSFLLDMSHQVNPTKSSLNQILFLLDYVTDGMTFSSATQQRLVTFLERLVEEYQIFQDDYVFSTPGFNADEASALFGLYGKMLGGATFRLQSNEISSSYFHVIDKLSYGICRQLGLNEEIVVTEETFGSLRLSRYTPANQFTTSCVNDENNGCPFMQQNTVDIDFSTALFNRYISWQCKSGVTCSGVCLTSVQLLRDILWDGNTYRWHSKSSSLSLNVINPRDGTVESVQDLSEPVELRFPILTSDSTTSQCVFWNAIDGRWSPSGCNTVVAGDSVICSCDHFSEFTVLAICPSGFYGDQCQFTCPSNMFYGEECSNECMCSIHGDCSPIDGSCDCNPGYIGSTCSSECAENYYGKNCAQQCQCVNGATCDHVSGTCHCTPGWMGDRCATRCPQGRYGQDCREECTCRDITECHHITGSCSCKPGYMGDDCKQECSHPFYGDGCQKDCTSQCHINGTATMECHHIEGPNCTCVAGYIGNLCQTKLLPPSPTPPPDPEETSSFPVALIIIPVLILVIIIAIVTAIVIHWRWKRRHSGKAKIVPADDDSNTEPDTKKSIFDGEDGIHLTRASSLKILSTKGSFDEEEDGIQVTRTKSLTVIVPPGAKLQDMFSESQQGATCSFKEPPETGGKYRWQIIHLKEKDPTNKPGEDEASGSQDVLVPIEKGDNEELALKQMQYHQGVYVDTDATLREVRDLFIETGQLELDQLLFQFLDPDSHNRLFSIEEEDAITLDSMKLKLPRTLFIKSIPQSKETDLDFCLCGRVAEFECTDCTARGYCSVECQQEDWYKHMVACKKQRKKKKKSKKKKKKHDYQLRSPDPNTCVCGAPAEMECSQCGVQGYCSEECQLADWEEHQLCCEPRTPSKPATPTNNSTKEIPANPDSTSIPMATGSIASITAEDKQDTNDKPKSNTGSLLGSNDSLLADDKV